MLFRVYSTYEEDLENYARMFKKEIVERKGEYPRKFFFLYLSDLKELMDFKDRVDEDIIINNNNYYDTIEIYNGYRE